MRTIELNHHSVAIRGLYSHFSSNNEVWRIGHKTTIKPLHYSRWYIHYA